ncbi:hypothetical protein pb186bvf_019056 [Paramecium bursaria]
MTLNYFDKIQYRNCSKQINQCLICQNDICLLCNDNYLLNVNDNQCIQKYYNYTIYNQNLMIQDHDSQFNLVTFLYFNYNYTDIIIQQKQFYLKDCQFNNYGILQRIESISCFSELNYLINNNQCSFYCNSCLNNMTCLDYKYILKFQISFTISSQYNNTYLNNSNNFILDFNSVHYLENNQHQLIIFINKISSSLIQFFLEIYYSTRKSQITLLIQFNSTNFQIDDYLTLNKPTIIQNSNLHIYKSLCVSHNSTNEEATFKIINSSFIGQSNQSYLLFNISKLQKIEIENLVFSNLSAFIFFAQAKTIQISNLTLINLNIRNQIQNCFMLQSDSLIIEKLQLINCSIQDNTFFEIQSLNINIVNLKIFLTKFQNSTFMRINGQMKANIQIQKLFMIKLELYNSKVFIAEYNCFVLNLFDLLVEQALSIDSYFIKLQRFYTLLIKNLSFLDNQLTNTCLIFVRSNIIYSQNIMIQRNSISSIEGIPSLCYEGEKINIIGLQYQQIHFKVFSILQILSNIIFINNLKLFNITSELQMLNFRTYSVIIINCQEIKIKNLELYDIKTQTNLILFQVFNLHLDNLKASAITIIDHQKQINIILFYATLKLEIQVISINDIFITSESNQLIHRLFFITSSNIILFNSLIQNLNCQKAIIFSISANAYIKLTKLQATNVRACILLDTQSDFNIITQLNFDQVEFTRNIVNYEPQNIQCYLLLTNLNITSSYLNMGIIQIFSQAYYKSFIEVKQIRAQNIQSTTLINIQLAFSITSIKNIRIIKSNLEGILFNICKHQLLTISNIIVKKVNFQDSSQYAIHIFSSEIYLTQLLVDYCQNFAFLINSNDFKIEKLIFSNSRIRYLFFYQNIDKQKECNKSIFRNIYLANNIQILDYQVPEIIYFAFYQKQHFIQGLSMFNNTSTQKGYLVGFRGKFILQILLINNNCQIHCLIIDPNSIILLRYQSDQINYLEKHQCLIGNTSKLIYNENYKQSKNIQITIQINSKIQIDNFKLLYIPSGQKLIRYKLYDFFNLKLDDYINQIKIIQYKDYNIYTILGSFTINIYEYNRIQQKVLRNFSQYQNLQFFQQTEIQSGLEQFKFNYNPYQENILMIDIKKVDDPSIQLIIYAKTQLCQMGEILVKDQCLVCNPELQIYSTKQKSNFCSIVDYSMISDHQQGSIKLKIGYWRPFVYSSIIEQCESKQNCQGGWHTGDNSCKIGYVGGNCNACDLLNVRGNGYYQLDNKECKLCQEFNYYQFVFKLILILIIYFGRLVLQMNSNIFNQRKILLQKLVNYRHYFILTKFISDRSSMVLNILIRNFAILTLIVQDVFDLPQLLTIFTNPIILEKDSQTCLNTIVATNNQNWIIASKIIIVILTFNLYITIIVITNRKQMKNYFIFPLISLFLYQGPTITVLYNKPFMQHTPMLDIPTLIMLQDILARIIKKI